MILSSCLLLLHPAIQVGDPAALHPVGAEVYVEIPDVAALVEAYPSAPVLQMIADAEVREAVAAVLATTELGAGDLFEPALGMLGLELEGSPTQELLAWLEPVRSVSLSISGWQEAEAFARVERGRLLAAERQLGKLSTRIGDFQEANEGRPPIALSELEGWSEDEALDPWGTPWVYEAAEQGYELASRGADRAAGGEGLDADFTPWDWMGEAENDLRGRALARLGTLVSVEFASAENAATILNLALTAVEGSRLELSEPRAIDHAGVGGELHTLILPGELGAPPAWILRADERLVLGFGASVDPAAVLARRAGAAASLAGSPAFAETRSKLPAAGGVTVAAGWLGVDPWPLFAAMSLGEEAMNAPSPVKGAGWIAWREELVESTFRTDVFLASGEETSAGGAWGITGGAVPESLWPLVPGDSVAVFATSMDPAPALRGLVEAFGGQDGLAEYEAMLASPLEGHGFHVERDFLAQLGPGAAGYMAPITTLMAQPRMGILFELESPQTVAETLEELVAFLAEVAPESVEADSKTYRGTPYWVFKPIIPGLSDGPMAGAAPTPTAVILHDRLLVTLSAGFAKKEIRRMAQGLPEATHPLAAGDVRPAEGASLVGYLDWGGLVGGIYSSARGLLGIMGMAGGGAENLPFDPAALPEPELFTRFFEPSVYELRPMPGGAHLHIESSLGPEAPALIVGAVAALVAPQMDMAADRAMAQAEEASAMAEMARIGSGIERYSINNAGSFPDSLEILRMPDAQGASYLDGPPDVLLDPWDSPYFYEPPSTAEGGYTLLSWGRDGAPGGEGPDADIVWDGGER